MRKKSKRISILISKSKVLATRLKPLYFSCEKRGHMDIKIALIKLGEESPELQGHIRPILAEIEKKGERVNLSKAQARSLAFLWKNTVGSKRERRDWGAMEAKTGDKLVSLGLIRAGKELAWSEWATGAVTSREYQLLPKGLQALEAMFEDPEFQRNGKWAPEKVTSPVTLEISR